MAGTIDGGQKAASTNKNLYGQNYYQVIGAEGGRKSRGGGFAEGEAGRERARIWGTLGGALSRKGDDNLTADEKLRIKHQIIKSQYRKLRSNKEANSELKQSLLSQKREFERLSRLQVTKLSDKYGKERSW